MAASRRWAELGYEPNRAQLAAKVQPCRCPVMPHLINPQSVVACRRQPEATCRCGGRPACGACEGGRKAPPPCPRASQRLPCLVSARLVHIKIYYKLYLITICYRIYALIRRYGQRPQRCHGRGVVEVDHGHLAKLSDMLWLSSLSGTTGGLCRFYWPTSVKERAGTFIRNVP